MAGKSSSILFSTDGPSASTRGLSQRRSTCLHHQKIPCMEDAPWDMGHLQHHQSRSQNRCSQRSQRHHSCLLHQPLGCLRRSLGASKPLQKEAVLAGIDVGQLPMPPTSSKTLRSLRVNGTDTAIWF
mmetsp:Transcript_138749/g.241259  ORF Transcript_138749/g.241259 Transcript_138749/m.241259 type:complete len:127 (+) Transcript_138749:1035-1415(+)